MRHEAEPLNVLDLIERERFRTLTRELVATGTVTEKDAPVLAFLLTAFEKPHEDGGSGVRLGC